MCITRAYSSCTLYVDSECKNLDARPSRKGDRKCSNSSSGSCFFTAVGIRRCIKREWKGNDYLSKL